MRAAPSQTMIMASGEIPQGYRAVPMIDVRPSAGPGNLAIQSDAEPDFHAVKETFLRRLGVAPAFARLMIASGDSMADTINDGDLMIVDTSIREIVDEGIYVLVFGGLVLLKRLQILRKGGVVLKSDNPRYEDEEIPAHELPDLQIEARVRWAGGAI